MRWSPAKCSRRWGWLWQMQQKEGERKQEELEAALLLRRETQQEVRFRALQILAESPCKLTTFLPRENIQGLRREKTAKKPQKKQKLNNTVISCVWPCLRKQDFCRQHEGKKWLSYLKNKSLISRKTLTSMRHQFVLWEAERNHKPWWASRLSRFWLVQCEMLLLSPGLSSWIWWRGRTPFYFCFTLR